MIPMNGVKLIAAMFILPCLAFTPAETNNVLHKILHRMVVVGSSDDWPTTGVEMNAPEIVANMDDLLSQVDCQGWGLGDKRQTFNCYLSNLAAGDARFMQGKDRQFAASALAYCYDLSYTNAVPYYRQLALNPHGFSREDAMRIYLKSVGVGADATSFTEMIMTNLQGNVSRERFQVIRLYSEMLLKRLRAGVSIQSGMTMFYRNRNLDVTGSMTIDKFLEESCEGYALSSNRLETCCFVLDNTNATKRMSSYFTAITNQLLSSGQPLRWINVGGTSE